MTTHAPTDLTLVIANKRYSSWSLRPWLALRTAGAAFDEVLVRLRTPETTQTLLTHGPSGKAPVLKQGDLTVWDSLAICEYVAELFPQAQLWPADAKARAVARAVAAEMHSGFMDLRRNLFFDLHQVHDVPERVAAAAGDIARIQALWADCRARFGASGPFLFGHFTIADAMYAPVCVRLRGWQGGELTPEADAYIDAIFALPAMREWMAAAAQEPWVIDYLNI
ncbi:glutathione S-transferase [Niveispirillum sp. SYP-B3756]|uniref:glutathione S-transferase family protein n=1 Tax=Niveispirillum sp. SYP-B3756 TaxID=2662178 RepID=UPI0012922276|nr:glutathione S-transferase family protein [Niveispirillum sp. SYP-B3756]MQP66637.1 glutathione S-transferase [Niveispirillum sp. SYP-B3756]